MIPIFQAAQTGDVFTFRRNAPPVPVFGGRKEILTSDSGRVSAPQSPEAPSICRNLFNAPPCIPTVRIAVKENQATRGDLRLLQPHQSKESPARLPKAQSFQDPNRTPPRLAKQAEGVTRVNPTPCLRSAPLVATANLARQLFGVVDVNQLIDSIYSRFMVKLVLQRKKLERNVNIMRATTLR